jgi:hypothetical protein
MPDSFLMIFTEICETLKVSVLQVTRISYVYGLAGH